MTRKTDSARLMARIQSDPRVRQVTEFLLERGASGAYVRRLHEDLASLPRQYERRRRYETQGERAERLRTLARKTRRLAREWSRDAEAQWWTVWPHLVGGGGGVRCDGIEVLRAKADGLPTVAEFLSNLAALLEQEAARELGEPLFTRRPSLAAYVTCWCVLRLAETGQYRRRPLAHAALLASAVLGRTVTTEAAKKYCDRLGR